MQNHISWFVNRNVITVPVFCALFKAVQCFLKIQFVASKNVVWACRSWWKETPVTCFSTETDAALALSFFQFTTWLGKTKNKMLLKVKRRSTSFAKIKYFWVCFCLYFIGFLSTVNPDNLHRHNLGFFCCDYVINNKTRICESNRQMGSTDKTFQVSLPKTWKAVFLVLGFKRSIAANNSADTPNMYH